MNSKLRIPLCWKALMLGRSAFGRGNLELAVTRLTEAVSLLARNDPGRSLVWCASVLSQTHAMRGDIDAANDALATAERARLESIHCYDVELALARTWVWMMTGQRARAQSSALAAAEEAFANGAWGAGVLVLHDAARIGAGRPAHLWEQARPHLQGPFFEVMLRGAVRQIDADLYLAVADDYAELGALLFAAENYAAAARRYARRGDTKQLEHAQNRCLTMLSACGGARTPALIDIDDLGNTAELTDREREIGILVAQGLANKAIAEQLGLSVRTVENHLARALSKLGLTNRRNLVGFFGQ